ncbi:MAG: PhzF family phenazine biosynthesis isomerase [Owenweeksia sp.]|nr:PhzF family phenazine biosynthesis isomerase [Owenweeksia sp.]
MSLPFSFIQVFDDPKNDFLGNISAVMLLDHALSTEQMQAIARDLNQPATTFLWPGQQPETFTVRWFAPDGEIGLCGHGSLAAIAYLIQLAHAEEGIQLQYKNGIIKGGIESNGRCSITLDPITAEVEKTISPATEKGLGVPIEAFFTTANKQIVLLKDEATLRAMQPDFATLRQSEIFGYTVTAPGDNVDFVSRTIVPHVRQLEDHATGSSHAALTPFWAQRLQKNKCRPIS